MKFNALLTATTIAVFGCTAAWSENYQVQHTLQVQNSPAEVWNLVGDFCDIDDWHPALSACTLKVIDGSLHRILTTVDGAEFVEKRIAKEAGLSYTYSIASSPLPLARYTATFSVEPYNGALITWSGRFSSDDPALETMISEIYQTGLAAIEAMLKN